jgi:hypothetical protein
MKRFICRVKTWHGGLTKMFNPGDVLEVEDNAVVPSTFQPFDAPAAKTRPKKTTEEKTAEEADAPAGPAAASPNPLPPART